MRIVHAIALSAALVATGADAQTARSSRDTVAAYGARLLNPADQDAKLNQRRINNRINNRIDNRISNRIERYRVGAVADPAAAYARATTSTTDAYGQAQTEQQRGASSTTFEQAQAAPNDQQDSPTGR